MKFKFIISVALALVMLLSLAMPVLADTGRGKLIPYEGYSASGSVVFNTTTDGYLDVAISLRKAEPNTTYHIWVQNRGTGAYCALDTDLITNSRGSGKVSGMTPYSQFDPGETASFRVVMFTGSIGSSTCYCDWIELTCD